MHGEGALVDAHRLERIGQQHVQAQGVLGGEIHHGLHGHLPAQPAAPGS